MAKSQRSIMVLGRIGHISHIDDRVISDGQTCRLSGRYHVWLSEITLSLNPDMADAAKHHNAVLALCSIYLAGSDIGHNNDAFKMGWRAPTTRGALIVFACFFSSLPVRPRLCRHLLACWMRPSGQAGQPK